MIPGCKYTFPSCFELLINQHPYVFLLSADLNPFFSQFIFCILYSHTRLGLVELHEVITGPLHNLLKVLWMASPPSRMLTAPHSLMQSANLPEGALIPLSKLPTNMLNGINLNTDWFWSQGVYRNSRFVNVCEYRCLIINLHEPEKIKF